MDSIELTYHYRGKAQQINNNCIVEKLSLLIFNVHTLFFLQRRSSPDAVLCTRTGVAGPHASGSSPNEEVNLRSEPQRRSARHGIVVVVAAVPLLSNFLLTVALASRIQFHAVRAMISSQSRSSVAMNDSFHLLASSGPHDAEYYSYND